MFMDGLRNIVANLGTARDKSSASTYVEDMIDTEQLVAMYRTSSIARKIIDLPAQDAMREWREWNAAADQISKLEAEEKRLNLRANMLKLSIRGRLFGGAAMFIGTGETNLEKPLNPERVGLEGIKYLTVLNRGELVAGDIEQDPRQPFYGKPKDYQMMGGPMGGQIKIHPSRLVISMGTERPDDFRNSTLSDGFGWGDPVLQSVMSDVRNLDATIANVASLVFEAKVDVIGISGFNNGLKSGGKKYEQLVLDRASLTATGKGINGAMVMDADDKYEQKSAQFSQLPDIIDRFMQMASAAADIPMMLLFGISPSGLNASGDGPIRSYYDRVKVHQTLAVTPAMHVLDECLIRSALGSRPDEVYYGWRPLWQPTQKERADTGKIIVDTFKTVHDMDLLPPDALGKAIVNGLTESGLAPGLEDDVAKWFESKEFKEQQEAAEIEPELDPMGNPIEKEDPDEDPEEDDTEEDEDDDEV